METCDKCIHKEVCEDYSEFNVSVCVHYDSQDKPSVTPMISCSHCGKKRRVYLRAGRDNVVKVARNWKSCGTALYCPNCAKEIARYTTDFSEHLCNILGQIAAHYEFKWREHES